MQRDGCSWSSGELAARGARGAFARIALIGWLRVLGVGGAVFAGADAAMGPQTFEDHFGCGRGGACVFAVLDAEAVDLLHQALEFCQVLMALGGGGEVRELECAAQFKPLNYRLEVHVGEVFAEDAADGGANEFAGDGVRAFEFAFVFEFHFSGDGGEGGVDVSDAGDNGLFAVASGALLGAADEAFERGDGKTLADAGAAVGALFPARV